MIRARATALLLGLVSVAVTLIAFVVGVIIGIVPVLLLAQNVPAFEPYMLYVCIPMGLCGGFLLVHLSGSAAAGRY